MELQISGNGFPGAVPLDKAEGELYRAAAVARTVGGSGGETVTNVG